MKISVSTTFNKDMIDQSILSDDDNNLIRSFTNQIIHLKEQGVIDALIALGWTPPKGVHGSNEQERLEKKGIVPPYIKNIKCVPLPTIKG